ncbi:MAG: hypothetical protein NTV25_06990, partial [Methanothrix sp.]|nr:hypothetical protein [Methanothrix sp.]
KQSFNRADQGNLGNENSTISEFPKTERAARSIPRPLGRGGRTQFDLKSSRRQSALRFAESFGYLIQM